MSNKNRYFARRKAKFNKEVNKAERSFPAAEIEDYWKKNKGAISEAIRISLLEALSGTRIYLNKRGAYGRVQKQELRRGEIEKYCNEFPQKLSRDVLVQYLPNVSGVIYGIMLGADDTAILKFVVENREKAASKLIAKNFRETKKTKEIIDYLKDNITEQDIFEQLLINPYYSSGAERYKSTMLAKKRLLENLQVSTPDDYTELFPFARKMSRKFVIHIGPTNSGKTYRAIEDLKVAENGIYLAPLRLLAYEQYEKMNREGVPCSMITGEERIEMPGSFHQASTIEMLDLREKWDVAVIDEAQMIADEQRGGSWTNAILGIQAQLIHVCASPDAEKALKRMIRSCGDTYEVVYHERKTPLVMDESFSEFSFPEDVQKGDALIVFSRKDVHSVAAELQSVGITCSIIYGSLPYDVRHREAGKFAEGATDVVVATDAIGMGMNLPVRRIVFLETVKFDGNEERQLNASEVKQIAGRAGRYGLYDVGYVTSYYDYQLIERMLEMQVIPIGKAMINIPEEFLLKDGKVSTILELWNKIPANNFYDKGDISEKIRVAKALEKINDNRELIRKFIKIPVNPDNRITFSIFMDYYRAQSEEREAELKRTMRAFSAQKVDEAAKDALQKLEISSQIYDFLYSFTRVFGKPEDLPLIVEGKREISKKIFTILDRQKLSLRVCEECGKRLNWSYKYKLCQDCRRKAGKIHYR